MSASVTALDVVAAHERTAPHVRRTPLFVSRAASQRAGATIAVKAEHAQLTGSFKVRGAFNKVLSLGDEALAAGVVTASSGNHGIAVSLAAGSRGAPCTVVLPRGASEAKVAAIAANGATVEFVDSADSAEAEARARLEAARTRAAYVSPYNDPVVVAGQGTVGLEIGEDAVSSGLDAIDAVVVAVGGGGLVSGIATWMRAHVPGVRVVAASPLNDRAMAASVEAGAIVPFDARPTFSDGTAGGVEPGAVTFDLCADLVDQWVDVTEREIASAVAAMIDDHGVLVEGSSGLALAAAERVGREMPGASIVAVSCGANVTSARLREMLVASC